MNRAAAAALAAALTALSAAPARAQPAPDEAAQPDTEATRAPLPAARPAEPAAASANGDRDDAPAELEVPLTADGWTAERVATRAVEVSEQIDVAEIDRIRATTAAEWRAAEFAPRLNLRATYTRLSEIDLPPFEFAGMAFESPFPQILNQYAMQASLTVPISDMFLAILPAYRAAKGSAEVTRWQTEVERQTAALTAREAFYGFARVEASQIIANDAVRLLEAYIADLEALFGAGQVTEADVLQARARKAEAVGQLVRLESARRVASHNIRILLDLPSDATIGLGEDLARPPAPLPDRAELSDGWRDRPEVNALQALGAVYADQADAVGAARWPSLSVQGNYTYANPNQRFVPQTEEFNSTWDVSVILSWSPNAAVGAVAQREDVQLQARRTAAELEALREGLELQLQKAVGDFEAATAALAAADEQVAAARAAWIAQRDLLRAGEATPNDVLDAESALRRAQATLFDIRIDCHLARARVDHALGRAAPVAGG